MNFLPACPAERINLNYPTKDQHWPKFIRKLRDCHTKLKVWCHIKVSWWHWVSAARAALPGAFLDWSVAAHRESTSQHCLLTPSLLRVPALSKVTAEVSLELLSAMKWKDSIHKEILPGQQGVSAVHLTHGIKVWGPLRMNLELGYQGSEKTLNKLFTSSVTQKLRSSSVAAPFQNLILD